MKYFKDILTVLISFLTFSIVAQNTSTDHLVAGEQYILPSNLTSKDYLENTLVLKVKSQFRNISSKNGINSSIVNQVLSKVGVVEFGKKFSNHNPPEKKYNELGQAYADLSLIYELKFAANTPIQDVINQLLATNVFDFVEPHFIGHSNAYTPNDPSIASQSYLNIINAKNAWDLGLGGSQGTASVVIGIVDAGSDMDHPDLVTQFVHNSLDPINGLDDDGDGYTDNYIGYDLAGADYNNIVGDNNPDIIGSNNDHGVIVSGCVAAATDNSVGVAGVGFNCKLLPVKCSADNSIAGDVIMGYEGITYAADHGAKIICCAWGMNTYSSFEQLVIDYATVNKNCLVVAAAGNNNLFQKMYPASYNYVLSVVSTANTDVKSSFSSYHFDVDISTPGQSILSTAFSNTYSTTSGTSQSSAITAGGAGLVQSKFNYTNALQIGQRLKQTSDNHYAVGSNASYQDKLGKGRLNLYRALTDPGIPSVVFSNQTIVDHNDNVFVIGDTLFITGDFVNYLDPTSSLSATISAVGTGTTYVLSIDNNTSIGVVNTLSSVNNNSDPFKFKVKPGTPNNTTVTFKVSLIDGTYSDNYYFDVVLLSVPVASYTISSPKCVGSPISFTDQSSGTPTSWAWTFPGGTPASSTSQNPSVTYTAAGTYSATLVATNASGSSSPLTQTFVVNPTPSITVNSGTITSGQSFTITPSGASTYTFSSGSAVVSPTINTSYTVTGTSAQGCVSSGVVSSVTVIDNIAPTTTATSIGLWKTTNFTETFTDIDNAGGSGIDKSFYQVSDYNGTEWRANGNRGFFYDDFNMSSISVDWTTSVGTWSINSNALEQSDELNANTNIYAAVSQTLSNRYLYTFKGTINGTGSNRRAGIHIMCDDPTQTNRGNNYFIWIRPDNTQIQLYKTTTNTVTLVSNIVYSINVGTTYDYKISYDRITGELNLWVNNSFVASWTDVTPFSSGSAVSFRSGNSKFTIDDFAVYRSRSTSTSILVGAANTNDVRYQNPAPIQKAGIVKSIVKDAADNWSTVYKDSVNVDWTSPTNILLINDGKSADINTVVTSDSLSANWTSSKDVNSAISKYWYSIGTTPGATNTLTWTATTNGTDTLVTAKSLTLTVGQVYYFNVKSEDGAGLISSVISTNGQTVTPACTAPSLTITGGGNFCPAQTKTLTATGTASTYSWMPGGATTSSIVVSPTITTVYTLTASNGGTCTSTYTVQLTANSNPVLSTNASPAAICPGGSSNLTAGGATTYTWSNGALTNTTVVAPTVTSTYTVIGKSVVGCTSTKTLAVTVNSSPTLAVNSGTICAGNSFTITPSGASTYTYSSGSAVVSPTSTSSYTIIGTAANTCTGSAISTVTVNATPTITVNSGGICAGNSYTITASGANTYTWNTGANTNSIVVTPTATTNYSVVGSSTLGCVSSSSAVSTVTVSSTPTLAVNSGSICLGNPFTMTPSGASTYTYSSGSAIVSPTVNTTYTVTGSSAFGCLGAAVVSSVTVYASPTLSITSNPSTACLGNTVTLTASGATTYSWNTGTTTNTLAVSPSVNTVYTVTGTTTGCSATKTMSVNPIDIVLSSTVTNIACNVSVNSGSISLLPSGGTFPYYYSWSNGATTANIKNLAVGSYSVLVSDANGCMDSLQLAVTRPTSLNVTTSIVNPACGANDGQISSTVSGGTAPYTYIWNSGATTPVASSLTPGQYIIQVYDASNCYGSAIVNLNPTNGPVVTVGTTNSVSCYGGNNGSTSISISGGIAPVTTQWSNGSTSNSLSGLSAGVYDVLVTDASGCKVNQTVVINQPNGLNVQPIVTRPNCTQSNGAISLNISGGQAPFTFTWSANAGGVNTQNVSGIASGYYNVTIGYNGACTQNIGVGVSDLTNIAVNVVTVTPSSCTAPTGSIDIMAVNGVPSYSFSWSNGASTEDINNVFPGNYFVTVTDADLCKTSTSVFVPSNIFDYQPEICLISVDTSNNTNYIVWQKNITYGVEKYKIYRESSVPNNFQFVADVPFSALSEYTDLVANADVHSWRYRLSSVDSCGYEIPSYVDHKTIYLDVTFGATTNDLTWNYYAGFSYNKFYISRYDITNGWQLYDSVPGNIFTYSDILPPPTGEVKYLVEAKAPFNCIPQLKTVVQTSNKTKSNVKNNNFEILTKLQDVLFDNYFFIAPNPAKDELFVNFNKPLSTLTHIRVKDLIGKVLFELTVKDVDKVVIPLKEFTSGLYFIQVENGKNTNVKKFVKE